MHAPNTAANANTVLDTPSGVVLAPIPSSTLWEPVLPRRSIAMANGFVLTFTEDQVPPPPAFSFADRLESLASKLERLNSMWDDTSAFWKGFSYLIINSHPIPIVYWKEVYTSKSAGSWKVKNWQGMKGKYFEVKVGRDYTFIFLLISCQHS